MRIDLQAAAGHSLTAEVLTASTSTGNSQIDATLKSADWFDTDNHPRAAFTATRILVRNDNTVDVQGSLSIKGITNAVQFPMKLEQVDGRHIASGSFTVNRLEFALGQSTQSDDSVVGFPVVIAFEIETQ